jgi:hypothetical protein
MCFMGGGSSSTTTEPEPIISPSTISDPEVTQAREATKTDARNATGSKSTALTDDGVNTRKKTLGSSAVQDTSLTDEEVKTRKRKLGASRSKSAAALSE